ncbi:MAG: hypothetical protein R6V53_02495 [Candidatus Woesearchaeota archaeon]
MAVSNALMYAGVVLVMILLSYWFVSNNPYRTFAIVDRMDADLIHLTDIANEACLSDKYRASYVPKLSRGELTIMEDTLCIELNDPSTSANKVIQRCSHLHCEHSTKSYSLNGSKIWITK